KMFDLMDHLKSKEARRQSLESIQKNHSNFYAGVKSVLQNAQSIQGIIGAVSEHLTLPLRNTVKMLSRMLLPWRTFSTNIQISE
ncbi:hypothetical protein, partial [Listeria monocytogenes]|uniref:hypothetical protein n=1 Tax=Listeria monocytogenes TaxID=1639 RepID=UPI0005447FFC